MRTRILLSIFFTFLCFGALVRADEPTGTIAGSVLDPSGAAIASAKVTATSLATGLTRTTMTANDGQFVIPLLPVGFYSITAEMAGFERFEQRGIEVRLDQSSSVTNPLKIGATTNLVTVQANAQMVETRSGALSQLITERNVENLPLNGRYAAASILLSPGAIDANARLHRSQPQETPNKPPPIRALNRLQTVAPKRIASTTTLMGAPTRIFTPTSTLRSPTPTPWKNSVS